MTVLRFCLQVSHLKHQGRDNCSSFLGLTLPFLSRPLFLILSVSEPLNPPKTRTLRTLERGKVFHVYFILSKISYDDFYKGQERRCGDEIHRNGVF